MKKRITFNVLGKPPQKSRWKNKNNAALIINLRKKALESRKAAGFSKSIRLPVKLKLTVYAPNIDKTTYVQKGDDDEERYIGDLDSLVAGVCDYLQPGPKSGENNFQPHPLFDSNQEVWPTIPIILENDSQIISISAKKKTSKKLYYKVELEILD